jgi:hypothetical protein
MSSKKGIFKPKPERTEATAQLKDAWVSQGREGEPPAAQEPASLEKEEVPMKRLTIDIPLDLHKRVKSQCADRGVKMADVVREFLESTFPKRAEQ